MKGAGPRRLCIIMQPTGGQPAGGNLNRESPGLHLCSALLALNVRLDSAGPAEALKVEHGPGVQWGLCPHMNMVTAAPGLATRDAEWSSQSPFAEGGGRECKVLRVWVLVKANDFRSLRLSLFIYKRETENPPS